VLERLGDGSQEVVRDRAWVQILRQFWDAERKPYSGGLPQFNLAYRESRNNNKEPEQHLARGKLLDSPVICHA
jgi:hypothetical protein